MIGQTLSHYRIVAKLGEGGMGEVYRAEDTTLKRQVALKVLPPDLASSQERLERFQREAEALAALDHPNIVTIHTVEEADGVRFLTMQLVEGKPLSDSIPEDGASLKQIFEVAVPLADALAAAHEKGVIHRDLKPANIMVGDDGRIKVLDFGLAKLRPEAATPQATQLPTEPLTAEGLIVGTMPYMSPEQLEGRELDSRSDIFSLGIILYELATGQRPFQGETSISLISSIVKDSPQEVDLVRDDLPHHLGRIVRRCLDKDPERRYQTAKEVRNELEDLAREITSASAAVPAVPRTTAHGEPAHGPAPSADDAAGEAPPTGESSPRRWAQWVIAAVVVLAVGGLFIARSRRSTERAAKDDEAVEVAGDVGVPAAESGSQVVSDRPMIVVLPFENLGAPEDEYFADGMTEELTSRLARVSGLRVISRTTAMQYKANRPSLKQIGEELGADFVLEGTVRWAKTGDGPDRVRITPQLIQVSDDSHLWADAYDRELDDIFEIQSDIAGQVIAELGVALLGDEEEAISERPTDNMAAYEAYLHGLNAYDGLEVEEATRLFTNAVELDPEFIEARALLARMYALRYFWSDISEDWLGMAAQVIEQLDQEAPGHPAVRMAKGMYLYHGLEDHSAALEILEPLAVKLSNNADVISSVGLVLRRMGRYEESTAAFERALAVDPKNPGILINLGAILRDQNRYEEAEEVFRRCTEIAPELSPCYRGRSWNTLFWTGDIAASREIADSGPDHFWKEFLLARLDDLDGDYGAAITRADQLVASFDQTYGIRIRASMPYAAGDLDRARAVAQGLVPGLEKHVESLPTDFVNMSVLGLLYAIIGQQDKAIELGERAIEVGTRDRHLGPFTWFIFAESCLILGETERAIELVDQVLATTHWDRPSHHWYRLDPLWAPLRDDPRFQAVLEKHTK